MLHILHNILRLGRVASRFGFFVAATAAAAAVCLAIAKNEFILIQGVVQAQPSLPFSGSVRALEIVLQFQLISMLINNNNS